ncbi:hypothetical protein WMY93_034335, partial [Mugilogobius chulae]
IQKYQSWRNWLLSEIAQPGISLEAWKARHLEPPPYPDSQDSRPQATAPDLENENLRAYSGVIRDLEEAARRLNEEIDPDQESIDAPDDVTTELQDLVNLEDMDTPLGERRQPMVAYGSEAQGFYQRTATARNRRSLAVVKESFAVDPAIKAYLAEGGSWDPMVPFGGEHPSVTALEVEDEKYQAAERKQERLRASVSRIDKTLQRDEERSAIHRLLEQAASSRPTGVQASGEEAEKTQGVQASSPQAQTQPEAPVEPATHPGLAPPSQFRARAGSAGSRRDIPSGNPFFGDFTAGLMGSRLGPRRNVKPVRGPPPSPVFPARSA